MSDYIFHNLVSISSEPSHLQCSALVRILKLLVPIVICRLFQNYVWWTVIRWPKNTREPVANTGTDLSFLGVPKCPHDIEMVIVCTVCTWFDSSCYLHQAQRARWESITNSWFIFRLLFWRKRKMSWLLKISIIATDIYVIVGEKQVETAVPSEKLKFSRLKS